MSESEFLDRETIEYYLCSTGKGKLRKRFVETVHSLNSRIITLFNKRHMIVVLHAAGWLCKCCLSGWSRRKWANRFVMNDKFTYTDFLESIEGNVEDGLWAIELVKLLKSYDFRYVMKHLVNQRCVYCTTNVCPSKRQYDYLDFYRVCIPLAPQF